MWKFWQRSEPAPLTESVRAVLARERQMSARDAVELRMLTERGTYAGRPVTYFRVVDPAVVALNGVDLRHYRDLDARPIAHSGHIERDGMVVLNADSSPGYRDG